MRECLSFHIGQAGVQVGNAVWELYCLEHGICCDGDRPEINSHLDIHDKSYDAFFNLTESNRTVPRGIYIDTEPTCIDEVRAGSYRQLFNPDQLISGKEDCASNYARGHFTIGKSLLATVMNQVRKLAENCDSLQGFLLYHSFGGGTGSGLTSLFLSGLMKNYSKRPRMCVSLYPSAQISNVIVEPYNSILNMLASTEFVDYCYVLDNSALYNLATVNLDVANPTFTTINRIVSQVVSGFTSPMRFEGCLNADILQCQTNLVPYPSIHYLVVTLSPLISSNKMHHDSNTMREITTMAFLPRNQCVDCNLLDHKFMACCLMYRGDVAPSEANAALANMKSRKEMKWVDWSPTGFKLGFNFQPSTAVPGSEISCTKRSLTGVINTSAIREPLERLVSKFQFLHTKRAFIHWYVGEGMEEGEFQEASDGVAALLHDYDEITESAEPVEEGDDLPESKTPKGSRRTDSQTGDTIQKENMNRSFNASPNRGRIPSTDEDYGIEEVSSVPSEGSMNRSGQTGSQKYQSQTGEGMSKSPSRNSINKSDQIGSHSQADEGISKVPSQNSLNRSGRSGSQGGEEITKIHSRSSASKSDGMTPLRSQSQEMTKTASQNSANRTQSQKSRSSPKVSDYLAEETKDEEEKTGTNESDEDMPPNENMGETETMEGDQGEDEGEDSELRNQSNLWRLNRMNRRNSFINSSMPQPQTASTALQTRTRNRTSRESGNYASAPMPPIANAAAQRRNGNKINFRIR